MNTMSGQLVWLLQLFLLMVDGGVVIVVVVPILLWLAARSQCCHDAVLSIDQSNIGMSQSNI